MYITTTKFIFLASVILSASAFMFEGFQEEDYPIENNGVNELQQDDEMISELRSHRIARKAKDDFLGKCLKVHNNYRQKHGVPSLKFSTELSKFAQQWADQLASKNQFMHRPNNKYAENLYMLKSTDPKHKATIKMACDAWYNEIKDYKFGVESQNTATVGHFSQMVWKSSKELGCGHAKSKKGMQIIVANYNPPGNVIGRFKQKVVQAKKH